MPTLSYSQSKFYFAKKKKVIAYATNWITREVENIFDGGGEGKSLDLC